MKQRKNAEKKLLLFGFDDLREIVTAETVAQTYGASVLPVGRRDYAQTLGALSGMDKRRESSGDMSAAGRDMSTAGRMVMGRMMVLCGLDTRLDEVLQALRDAGVGTGCVKAVLTRHNRSWTPVQLYAELLRESDSLRRGRTVDP